MAVAYQQLKSFTKDIKQVDLRGWILLRVTKHILIILLVYTQLIMFCVMWEILARYRKYIVEDIGTQKNRIEKTLQMAGIKLSTF